MTNFDFSPLLRTAIGFDRLARQASNASAIGAQGYPPYNIEKTSEDQYRLTMAVAGFRSEDVDIIVQDNALVVTGRVANDDRASEVLYRGIAARAFERRFTLADHIVVEGADLRDGLLYVGLKRVVPDALKPRRVSIGAPTPANLTQANPNQPSTVANDPLGSSQAA